MSMFSSFDALGAESFGQKVSFSWASGTLKKDVKQQQGSEQKTPATNGGGKDGTSSLPSTPNAKKPQESRRRPRFAVELDGVHCFETIIPY